MKKIIVTLIIIAVSLTTQAQGIYNDGARIVSQSGTFWVVSGGSFTLTSTSDITFGNLKLDNNGGLTLTNASITVNETLDLTSGILTTGANSATIGSSGSIINAGSSNYVSGKLAQTCGANVSKVFPIGKGGNYRPLTFNYTALTETSVVTAEQTETGMTGTLPANTTLLTSGRYWTISQTGGTNLACYLTLDATGYSPSHPVVMLKKEAGTITSQAATTPNYTNATALTSLGDFALATFIEPPGNALALDGSDDFVNAGNDASVQLSQGTLEAWIKTSGAGSSYRGIVVKQMAYGMFLTDNVLTVFQWADPGTNYSTGINLADNRWHHVAFCFNSGVTNGSFIYIDGVLAKTITYSILNQGVELAIGNGSAKDKIQNFMGSIDEVRVWNTVRTQSQIQSTLYAELAGAETGLVAYFNCNQGVAGGDNTGITTLNDLTSRANNGALTFFDQTGTTSNFVESYALAVPVPAAATNISGTGFTASWTAPATGTVNSYKLDVSTSSTFTSFVAGYNGLDCGTSLSQAVSGLTANITYYYRVRANKTSVTGTGGYYGTPITAITSCANPADGGTITAAQISCSPFDPALITSSALPTGFAGTLEYKWQLSVSSGSDGFSDISNTNSSTYDPPAGLTADTWYRRLARVSCVANWTGAAISNAVKMTVTPASVGGAVKW